MPGLDLAVAQSVTVYKEEIGKTLRDVVRYTMERGYVHT